VASEAPIDAGRTSGSIRKEGVVTGSA
jgi:hypothetical protein